MSALEQRNKKQRAAPPVRDKRSAAGGQALDDNNDDATTPALAVELRTDGYRVAALPRPAPLSVEAKRARGQQKPPERPLTFGELQPYGTAAATALLKAIDRRVLPRALAPGMEGVVVHGVAAAPDERRRRKKKGGASGGKKKRAKDNEERIVVIGPDGKKKVKRKVKKGDKVKVKKGRSGAPAKSLE